MPFGGKILGVYLKFVSQERQGDDGFYRRKRIVRGRPVKKKIVVRLKLNCWFIGNESDFSPAFVLCRTDSVWGYPHPVVVSGAFFRHVLEICRGRFCFSESLS